MSALFTVKAIYRAYEKDLLHPRDKADFNAIHQKYYDAMTALGATATNTSQATDEGELFTTKLILGSETLRVGILQPTEGQEPHLLQLTLQYLKNGKVHKQRECNVSAEGVPFSAPTRPLQEHYTELLAAMRSVKEELAYAKALYYFNAQSKLLGTHIQKHNQMLESGAFEYMVCYQLGEERVEAVHLVDQIAIERVEYLTLTYTCGSQPAIQNSFLLYRVQKEGNISINAMEVVVDKAAHRTKPL